MFRTSPVHHQECFVQAVFADLVCGTTRTARHVQPLHSSTRITTYQSLQIQLVQNAPGDGPVRSETCRANISAKQNSLIETLCVSCWTAYILQDDTRSLQYQYFDEFWYLRKLYLSTHCICTYGSTNTEAQFKYFQFYETCLMIKRRRIIQ